MSDVLYSDVKFIRGKGNTDKNASPSTESTYSEVKISKTQLSTEISGSQQQLVSKGRSIVTCERVALVVLSVHLAAAVIALGLTSYKNIQIMGRMQQLEKELNAFGNTVKIRNNTCKGRNYTCPKCEDGWKQHGGKCYYFSIDRSSWEESRRKCEDKGGDLVKIESTEEQEFLKLKVSEKMDHKEDKFWIGLTDSKEESKWLWTDGSPLNMSLEFWFLGEPDDWKGENPEGEDCARMGEKSSSADINCWFDKDCRTPHKRICNKAAKTRHLQCV